MRREKKCRLESVIAEFAVPFDLFQLYVLQFMFFQTSDDHGHTFSSKTEEHYGVAAQCGIAAMRQFKRRLSATLYRLVVVIYQVNYIK